MRLIITLTLTGATNASGAFRCRVLSIRREPHTDYDNDNDNDHEPKKITKIIPGKTEADCIATVSGHRRSFLARQVCFPFITRNLQCHIIYHFRLAHLSMVSEISDSQTWSLS